MPGSADVQENQGCSCDLMHFQHECCQGKTREPVAMTTQIHVQPPQRSQAAGSRHDVPPGQPSPAIRIVNYLLLVGKVQECYTIYSLDDIPDSIWEQRRALPAASRKACCGPPARISRNWRSSKLTAQGLTSQGKDYGHVPPVFIAMTCSTHSCNSLEWPL